MAETPDTEAEEFAQLTPQKIAGDELVEVRIAAYGIGEHLTVTVPARWEARIKTLEPHTQYGPEYQRRIVDTLVDVTHHVRSGYLDLAERGVKYCEEIASG